jgi:hypothetical protein
MAKRIVKWTVDGNILKLSKVIGSEGVAVVEAEFDIIKLFPEFDKFTDVQKQLSIYGLKQKLMDCGADVSTSDEKISSAKTKWQELLDGKWTGERVNGTGAAENKAILANVKTASKEVTLQGLLIKQALFPTTFTAEDEVKLQEFLAVLAKSEKKK